MKQKLQFKKMTAWLLMLIMMLTMLPAAVLAVEAGDLNVSAVAGDGMITVTWDRLEGDGITYVLYSETIEGENYTEYKDEPYYDDGKYICTIEGLVNDTTYTVGVEATCEKWDVDSINASTEATPYAEGSTVPDAPVITGVSTNDGSITVNWNAPENNGGAKILGYEIDCSPADAEYGNGGMLIGGIDADTTSFTIEDLTIGETYAVKVYAINAVGTSDAGTIDKAQNSDDTWDNSNKEFVDVHAVNHWAAGNVDYVYTNGLMKGTDETHFSPDAPLTRAMLVTVLYRLENQPVAGDGVSFADVDRSAYYANAVTWAKQNDIVNGVSENEFAPNDNITREQIAAIVFRYADYKDAAPKGAWAIRLDYADIEEISDYATEAVMYCKLKSIMQGKENNGFAPKDNATRGEAAAILERLIKAGFDAEGHDCDEIAIIYTNDVHCGIEDNIGYSGLAAYKKEAEEDYEYVTLADCGDAIQGDFVGTVSNGEYVVDIMNELDYSFAVLGNHEFDYGMQQLSYLINKSEAQYLGCNITYSGSGENLLSEVKPYEIVEYGDTKVAFIGVTTPESHTKSTPTYFMEDGEYVYNFSQGNGGQDLYRCVQKYVDECEELGADYIIVLAHLGDAEESSPYTSVELIQATDGIDAVLDGHSHSVIPGRSVENKNGEEVLLSSTGTKLANIGKLVICEDGTITTELISEYAGKDAECSEFIENIKAKYSEEMNRVIATSDISLSCKTEDGIRLVRNRETTIGNLCADAYRAIGNADIGVVNGGGIRADIPRGDITYADMLAVHPFGNTLCVVKATGQEIIDLLETACMYTKAEFSDNGNAIGENGGFMQVSGLKFTIDTSVPSAVVLDENENFVSVSGERRVKNVMVENENGEYVPIELDGIYTVASHNYMLKNGGDSYTKFMDNEFLISEGISDYQVLTEYITKVLGGNLSEKYAETEDRIIVK